jgi:hypothetical protein
MLKQKTLLEICYYFTSSNYPEFLEQLNDNQKEQFIDLLQNKIGELYEKVITKDHCDESVLSILQYHLDKKNKCDSILECDNCKMKFQTKYKLQRHINSKIKCEKMDHETELIIIKNENMKLINENLELKRENLDNYDKDFINNIDTIVENIYTKILKINDNIIDKYSCNAASCDVDKN